MAKIIATVADTVMGYGSSQILATTKSIAELVGSEHIIFQPFVPHRPFVDLSGKGYKIETISSVEHPWSWTGRVEYLKRVAAYLNDSRPDILLLSNYSLFPILDLLAYRPRKTIHLALEDLGQFGSSFVGGLMTRKIERLSGSIDVWIYPEFNRAVNDAKILGVPWNKMCVVYNVPSPDDQFATPLGARIKRIAYAGSVDFHRSVAHFLGSPPVAKLPIDVFGSMSGEGYERNEFVGRLSERESDLRYFGEISAEELRRRMPQYGFSIVFWLPTNFALRNAAPNKFFQSIAAGVPVIAAPHPQCRMLIDRYGAGIILTDWTYNTLLKGLHQAVDMIGTDSHEEMIESCKTACESELNWDNQFGKIQRILGL